MWLYLLCYDSFLQDGFLEACRCNGVQFTCLDPSDTLLANEELVVCVWSVSGEVTVDSLDTMVSEILGIDTQFASSKHNLTQYERTPTNYLCADCQPRTFDFRRCNYEQCDHEQPSHIEGVCICNEWSRCVDTLASQHICI